MCTDCGKQTSSFSFNSTSNTVNCGTATDSQCVVYTGPNMTALGVTGATCLQDILQRINILMGVAADDFTQYSFGCLANKYSITNQGEFIYATTDSICKNIASIDNILNIVIPNNISSVNNSINGIKNPNLESPCPDILYNSNNSIFQVITSISNTLCSTNVSIRDISNANWNSCNNVTVNPSNLKDAFNIVLNQICSIKNSNSNTSLLPSFDNSNNCLNGTNSDTLEKTISTIITRLCSLPTFSSSLYNSQCVVTTNTSLDQLNQNILSKIDEVSVNAVREFSSDFAVTFIDDNNPCRGKKITLNTSINQDRLVASSPSDTNPGTLQQKLLAGDNIILDIINDQLKISSSINIDNEVYKVKSNAQDTNPDFLGNKVTGGASNGISIITGVSADGKVQIIPMIDISDLASLILDEFSNNSELMTRLCQMVNNCGPSCVPPINVSISS